MRKRSKYRPGYVMLDPVSYVVNGTRPAAWATEPLTMVGLKNHSAIKAIQTGTATVDDAKTLSNAINMATALAHMGQGSDWLPELKEAELAIKAAASRSRFVFTGPELVAVNTAMIVHERQIEDPKTTIKMLETAAAGLRKLHARGKSEAIEFKQGVMQ